MSHSLVSVINGTEGKYKITTSVDGVVQNHTLFTGARLHTSDGTILADSSITPSIWDFTNQGYILVKLGLASLPTGRYTCYLVTTDSNHTTGLSWETPITLNILP